MEKTDKPVFLMDRKNRDKFFPKEGQMAINIWNVYTIINY